MTVKEMKKRGYEDHLIAESSGFSATDDEEIIEAKLYREILAQKKPTGAQGKSRKKSRKRRDFSYSVQKDMSQDV